MAQGGVVGEFGLGPGTGDLQVGDGPLRLVAVAKVVGQQFTLLLEAVFVDRSYDAVSVIRKNLSAISELEGRARIVRRDSLRFLKNSCDYDIIYIDPPYASDLREKALELLSESPCRPGQILIVELYKKDDVLIVPGRYRVLREKLYGDTKIIFYRRGPHEDNNSG